MKPVPFPKEKKTNLPQRLVVPMSDDLMDQLNEYVASIPYANRAAIVRTMIVTSLQKVAAAKADK